MIGTRDVTAQVRASGLPMDWSVEALGTERREMLRKLGLLVVDPEFDGYSGRRDRSDGYRYRDGNYGYRWGN